MKLTPKQQLAEFKFVQSNKKLVQTPTILNGEFGKLIYEIYREKVDNKFQGNKCFKLRLNENGEVEENSFFDSVLIDEIVRPYGIRTPTLADFANPELMNLIRNKYWTTSRDLVFQSGKYECGKNNPILESLLNVVEGKEGKVEFPFLVRGFNLQNWLEDKKGYQIKLVPSDDFEIIYDDRFDFKKYSGWKFNNVDEKGIPIGLDKNNGSRALYLKDNGLSRLDLVRDLYLFAYWGNLHDSYTDGRVVLVSDEGK